MAPASRPLGLVVLLLGAVRPQEMVLGPMGIDLQTCIANFNVHNDKIIRTQDSQNMGARYLNEADLGSRVECLRLCCETEDCDVFVFEENAGSCYLFQCGPPEDFKCKFTHHENYSSAVLAVSRHVPDLERQIKLTKHVQELAKLRAKPITTTTTAAPITREVTSYAVRRCSRYQFECRSNGECIAIYNACDGIAQCADGSDEAAELGCPAAPSAAPPPRKAVSAAPLPQAHAAVLKYGREGELVEQPPRPAIYPPSPYQVGGNWPPQGAAQLRYPEYYAGIYRPVQSQEAPKVVVTVPQPPPQRAAPFKMADDTQDGQARIPRGAILSLTVGLVLTAVMAILIGCRLRVVRRRLRKGDKGYAHDADYLVNGMYL